MRLKFQVKMFSCSAVHASSTVCIIMYMHVSTYMINDIITCITFTVYNYVVKPLHRNIAQIYPVTIAVHKYIHTYKDNVALAQVVSSV